MIADQRGQADAAGGYYAKAGCCTRAGRCAEQLRRMAVRPRTRRRFAGTVRCRPAGSGLCHARGGARQRRRLRAARGPGRARRDNLRRALPNRPGNVAALGAMAQLRFNQGNISMPAFMQRRLVAAPADRDALLLAAQIEDRMGDAAAAAPLSTVDSTNPVAAWEWRLERSTQPVSDNGDIGIPEAAAGCGRAWRENARSRGHEPGRGRRTPEDAGARGRIAGARGLVAAGRAGVRARAVALFAPARPHHRTDRGCLGRGAGRPGRIATAHLPPRPCSVSPNRPRAASSMSCSPPRSWSRWLATRPHLAQVTAQTASLDVSVPQSAHSNAEATQPMVASLAPMPASQPAASGLVLKLDAGWV